MNPHQGDVTLEVAGKQYVLRYSHRSLVLLEDKLDKGLMQIMRDIDGWKTHPENMRLGTIAAMLWAGLQKHHPDMTLDDATDLLDEVEGGTVKIIDVIGEGFQRGFSAPGTKGTNPPQKLNGDGTTSSSNTSASGTSQTASGRSLPGSASS
jgi:hypothetical protein